MVFALAVTNISLSGKGVKMRQRSSTFWNSKKVLVTGGSGFLGKSLVPKLLKLGANVFIPRSAEFDLRNERNVKNLFNKIKPEIVVHLAVHGGGIGYMRKYPGRIYHDNILINTHVTHYSMISKVKKFVGIGTVCEYPKFTPAPFREQSLWNGYPEETNAPYGLAKKMLLVQSQAYRVEFGFNGIHLLLANLFGPHDNFHPEHSHVVPGLIAKMVNAKMNGKTTVEVWGTGTASRDFLYVDDAVKGILLATERYDKPDPVNIGTGHEIIINELVHLVARLTKYDGNRVWNTDQPDGQPRRCLDVSKAKKEFGFESKTSLEQGLKKTISWYENEISKLKRT
jgi:GDP-L-fucose synthase